MTLPGEPTDSTPLTQPFGPPAPLSTPGDPYTWGGPAYLTGDLGQALLPAPHKRRLGLVVGIVLAVLVVLGGGATIAYFATATAGGLPGATIRPATFTANGTFAINGGCSSIGYSDLHAGTQVILTDEKGTVLAVAPLEDDGYCRFVFTLHDVPPGRKFYGVTISHRGTIQYTEDELRRGVTLSIG